MRALVSGFVLALVALAGCNANRGSAVSFAFNRPERLDFACLAPYPNTVVDPAKVGQYAVLPRSCCRLYEASNYRLAGEPGVDPNAPNPESAAAQPECVAVAGQAVGSPILHALVTQSTRGEVAAVDLANERVLDSDRQVPGYTFLDTGGLPTAIVVPPRQPHSTSLRGPEFVFVASAEERVVRAIPTCRFRGGSSCGPDKLPANLNDPAGYTARLRVSLRDKQPEDMLLGPDEALWVTLPEEGLIARIELAQTPADGVIGDAFAPSSDPTMPGVAMPEFFRVPAVRDAALAEAVAESSPYAATCGLGSKYLPTSFTLPLAPRSASASVAEPTRLYYDQDSQLLFVADRAAPGIHVFKLGTDGTLTAIGDMPTGQPVREFAITPRVPALAVAGAALLQDTVPAEDASTETKRYLYAIDELGTLAVFDFATAGAGTLPVLTPLLVPQPDLLYTRYADRVGLPAPSQTLAVIDTRSQSAYSCGQESVDALRARKEAISNLPRPLSAELLREQARVDARIAVYDTADLDYLRGVFVSVASTSGVVSMIDVHDLDNLCRAQKFCCRSDGQTAGPNGRPQTTCLSEDDLTVPRSADAMQSLAVRRHALRRRTAGKQTADVSTTSLLQAQDCDPNDPSAAVRTLPQVCTPADPWSTYTETWRVDFEGSLPNSQMAYASLETVADANKLALVAPAEFDLCERGVEPGDLVAVIGPAPDALRADCPNPSVDAPPTFVIEQATRDRLIMAPRPEAGEDPAALRQRVLDCYPDFVGVELRASNFLVLGTLPSSYLHRITSAPDGTCVVNETLDRRLDSRMRPGQVSYTPPATDAEPNPPAQTVDTLVFRNPFVSFALAPADATTLPTTRETSLAVQRSSAGQQLNTVVSGDQVTDALPSTLQYMPEVGYLFLLDTKGQGLRRYTLRPFQRDDTVFR